MPHDPPDTPTPIPDNAIPPPRVPRSTRPRTLADARPALARISRFAFLIAVACGLAGLLLFPTALLNGRLSFGLLTLSAAVGAPSAVVFLLNSSRDDGDDWLRVLAWLALIALLALAGVLTVTLGVYSVR